jgi:pimeloyl-ACP methyl ester carboxylesterase
MLAHVDLPHASYSGGVLSVEYAWLHSSTDPAFETAHDFPHDTRPVVVFLHEGLGSVSMWRDFPSQLCQAVGAHGLVYSREGYGNSTPRPLGQAWQPTFMHHQAQVVLPALLRVLGVSASQRDVVLLGHSDGASIALLAALAMPDIQGVVAMSAHTFVEDQTIDAIKQATGLYEHTVDAAKDQSKSLRQALSRHHADTDSAFGGWSSVWLSPAFSAWDIRQEIAGLRCPCIVLQGLDDPYGSNAHAESIKTAVPQTQIIYLEQCGHNPHKDCARQVEQAVRAFLSSLSTSA